MKHHSFVTALTIIILGIGVVTEVQAGPKARANIGFVSKGPDRNAAGKHIILVTIKTDQCGVQFFGTLNCAFEITDAQGQKYYGKTTSRQQSAYRQVTELEWRIQVNVDEMDKPTLTGYSLQYFAPDVPEPLDEKNSQCKTREELEARNSGSKPLSVRGHTVAVVGGRN